ncbi:MAG: sulfite oxidase heme-binding subunit YedZ [Burkholderiales bacterium]
MIAQRPASLRHIENVTFRRIRAGVFLLCLAPLARLVVLGSSDGLTANPIEFITRSTGTWTLVFLLITLAVTPLRRALGWAWLLRLRRMLGLYAFFYGCLHLTTYVWLDQFFDPAAIARDIVKRPFITMGFTAFVLMLPLALTSTHAMVRRLGAARWQRLHRLAYAVSVAGVVHYWWLVKRDVTQPLIYALLLAVLLLLRVGYWIGAARGREAKRGAA